MAVIHMRALRIVAPIFSLALFGYAANAGASDVTGADLNTPENPASSIVGGNTQAVSQPATPAALASGLLNGFDASGHFKTGVAMDIAPALFIAANRHDGYNPDIYGKGGFQMLLARTSLSLAVAKGPTSSDRSASIGFGLRSVIIDAGDPVLDDGPGSLRDCLTVADQRDIKGMEGSTPPQPGNVADKKDTATKKCRTAAAHRLWNRSAWDISAASSILAPDGSFGRLAQEAYAVTSTLAYGFDRFQRVAPADFSTAGRFEKYAQLLIGTQYVNGQDVVDNAKKKTFYRQDSYQIGIQAKLRLVPLISGVDDDSGAAADFSFRNTLVSLAGVYKFDWNSGKPNTNEQLYTLSMEFKIRDSLYIDLGMGADRKEKGGASTGFAATQLHYNFSKVPKLFD